jgi:tetratricopeptide (TPR) repeat protein
MVHDRLSTQEQKRVAFSTLRMILRAIGFSDMDQIGVENNQDQGGGKLDGHKLDSHLSAYLALVKDLWEEGLPPEIPSKAFIFLGSFSDDHGRLSDAEYCLKMALRKEPHSVFESCSASFGLGSLLNRERRYEDAEQILWGGFGFVHDDKLWAEDENQDLRENLMLTFYVNMARSLLGQGRSTEAENFASNGLKRCTEHFGPDHSRTFEVLETLGTMYEANQDYDRAEAMRRQQLTAFSSRLDNNDLILLHTRRKLVKVCVLKGNFTEAETLLRGTLRVVERRLGTTHPDHSTVMRALARLCDLQGRHDEAEEMFRRVLDAREGLLGKEHPDTLLVLHDLARCFFGQARYVEAEEIYRRVLSSIQIVLGKEHRETLWVEENLARCLNKAGNRDEAEMLLQKVRQSRAKTSAKGLDLPRSFA